MEIIIFVLLDFFNLNREHLCTLEAQRFSTPFLNFNLFPTWNDVSEGWLVRRGSSVLWNTVATNVVLTSIAPGVPGLDRLRSDQRPASVAASGRCRTHVGVWIAVLHFELMAFTTPHAVGAEVKITQLRARVVAATRCDLEVRATGVADEVGTRRRVHHSLRISPPFLDTIPEENDGVAVKASRALSPSMRQLDDSVRRLLLLSVHATPGADVVVTVLAVASEVADPSLDAFSAQVTIHENSSLQSAVADSRESLGLEVHGVVGRASLARLRKVLNWPWPTCTRSELSVLGLELLNSLLQKFHLTDEGHLTAVVSLL